MTDSTLVIRVDDGLKAAFADAAKAADRTASQVLRDLMRGYIKEQARHTDYDAWLRDKVAAGRSALAKGETVSGDEAEAHMAARRRTALRKATR